MGLEMETNKRIIALLTGRGNNTLKDKNILPVLGKPLLYYPATAAKDSGVITDFFVSSDDEKILQAAENCGYKRIIRPEEFARPDSQHVDVIDHAVEEIKKMGIVPDILVVLLANTVMVKAKWVRDCVNGILNNPELTTMAPVYREMDHHPYRAKQLNENGDLVPFFDFTERKISTNRQDLPPAFFLCHNFWVLNLNKINREKSFAPWTFMGDRVKPYEVEEAFDVHTMEDIRICEKWLIENGLVSNDI
jgi:N-acylneuraminate cytidylyltransferase